LITYTGERVIPDLMKPTNGMLLEHIARYQFAIYYSKGRVLDIATGCGFGAQIIAKAKKKDKIEIIGVDSSEEAILYAKTRYHHPKVQYVVADATDRHLPSRLGKFDTIISFETLEHLHDDQAFLDNVYKMLNPGGTFIISTPFGQGRGKPTSEPFHVHQLTEDEFWGLFTNYSSVIQYYQRGVLIEPKRFDLHYPIGIAVCTK